MTDMKDRRAPDSVLQALTRIEGRLHELDDKEVIIFSREQAEALVELVNVMGKDGPSIIGQIVARTRRKIQVDSWFAEHRARAARISGWVLSVLAFAYAIRDTLFDIWRALKGG